MMILVFIEQTGIREVLDDLIGDSALTKVREYLFIFIVWSRKHKFCRSIFLLMNNLRRLLYGLVSCLTVKCQKEFYSFGEGQILVFLNEGYCIAPFFFIIVVVSGILFNDNVLRFLERLPFMMVRNRISE